MSFLVNGVELTEITFNTETVNSVYYNGSLIWGTAAWPGWEAASWADIYALCKAKQNGSLTEWPSDVVLGAKKTTTLSSTFLGSDSLEMMVIGIDIDGDGVLTFHSSGVLEEPVAVYGSSLYPFYRDCDANPYIKSLSKGSYSASRSTLSYNASEVWLLSGQEIGATTYTAFNENSSTTTNAECTYGVNEKYPYYANASARIKTKADGTTVTYALRSFRNSTQLCTISNSGSSNYADYNNDELYIAPAFAIG